MIQENVRIDCCRLVQVVLLAVMTTRVSAEEYRFAADGSDVVARVNALDLKPGDRVLFKCGDLFRGSIHAKTGVTYGAWGEGAPPPTVCNSRRDYADPALWKETDAKNVWRCTEKIHNAGIVLFDRDPRNVSEGSPLVARMRYPALKEPLDKLVLLDADLTFRNIFREDRLELRSDLGNPGSRFKHIEIGEHGHCVRIDADDLIVENLHLTLSGSHGVGGSGDRRNIEVRHCTIDWLGGSIIEGWKFGTVRFGNGVEIWGGVDGFRVHDNVIHDIYDTGVTVQCNDLEDFICRIRNVEFRSNVIERCFWGLEYYNKNNAPGSFTRGLHFIGNVCRDIGRGWGCEGREWRAPAINLGETPEGSADILVKGNVFDGSTGSLVTLRAPYPKGVFVFRNNTYCQRKGNVLIRYTPIARSPVTTISRENMIEFPFGDDAEEVIRRELGDDGCVTAMTPFFERATE